MRHIVFRICKPNEATGLKYTFSDFNKPEPRKSALSRARRLSCEIIDTIGDD